MRAVTFDVSRTLIHCPRLAEIYTEVLTRHGHEVRADELRPHLRWVWQELSCRVDLRNRDRFTAHEGGARGFWHRYLERLCEHLELGPPSRFASAELYESLARGEAWAVFTDVRPALDRLVDAGLRLAVISNWDERLPRLLDALELGSYFEAVVHSSACGVEKPHAGIFNACLDRLGTEAAETLHIGDDPVLDIEGARAAGFEALHLDREKGEPLHRLIETCLPVPRRSGRKV